MNTTTEHATDWASTRQNAAEQARRLRPLALAMTGLVVAAIVVEDFLRPILALVALWRVPDPPSLWVFLQRLSLIWLAATPTLALASALWAGQRYLQQLTQGEVWSVLTAQLLRRVGSGLALSAALSAVLVPTGLRWIQAQGGIDWQLDTASLVLAALGGLLLLVSNVLRDVLHTASALKTDSESFV